MRYELKLGVLTAAVALALGLTACGGGDKKPADGKSATAAASLLICPRFNGQLSG